MKKLIQTSIAIFSLVLVISACSSTKSTTTSNVSRGKFVGTWTCNNVSYDGLVQNAVQSVFDQAPPKPLLAAHGSSPTVVTVSTL
jgi:hypothetical protein